MAEKSAWKPKLLSKPVLLNLLVLNPIVAVVGYCTAIVAAIGFLGDKVQTGQVMFLMGVVVGFMVGFIGVRIVPLVLERVFGENWNRREEETGKIVVTDD